MLPSDEPPVHASTPISQLLSFDPSTGWIVVEQTTSALDRSKIQLCWLPAELRGFVYNAYKSIFVMASAVEHQLVVIDFEPMLSMLRRSHVML
jgi:hypothetical protein